MKLFLVVVASLYLCDGYIVKHCPDLVKFDGKFYEKNYLVNGGVSKPFQLTYDKEHNNLLYHEDSEPFGKSETHLLNVATKHDQPVPDVDDAVVSDVYQNGQFLVGTSKGIYVYNPTNGEYKHHALDVQINELAYTNGVIWYVNENKYLYSYENGQSKLMIDEPIDEFVIDDKGNLFVTNATGLYYASLESILKEEELTKVGLSEELPIESLVEFNNVVYVVSTYGVFKVDTTNNILVRVSMKSMFAMIPDGENMIYSDEEHIVQLVPTTKVCA